MSNDIELLMKIMHEDIKNDAACLHERTITDGFLITCIDCDEFIGNDYIHKDDTIPSTHVFDISKLLPSFFSDEVKRKILDTWCEIISKFPFRTAKLPLVAGCIYCCTIGTKDAICFEDLKQTFKIKGQKIINGIIMVSQQLDHFSIPFDDDTMLITYINMLGMDTKKCFRSLQNLIYIIKQNSFLFNTSHSKSIVSSCIYFWLKINHCDINLNTFAAKIKPSMATKVSASTISKKFYKIKEIVYTIIFPNLLHDFIRNCDSLQKFDLVAPEEDLFVEEKTRCKFNIKTKKFYTNDMQLFNISCAESPNEWNILLDTVYYDFNGMKYSLHIITDAPKNDISFKFKNYNEINKTNGAKILNENILKYLLNPF